MCSGARGVSLDHTGGRNCGNRGGGRSRYEKESGAIEAVDGVVGCENLWVVGCVAELRRTAEEGERGLCCIRGRKMGEAAVAGFQSKEFSRAAMMFSDLEFAFQLQLNEALSASASSSGVSFEPELEIGSARGSSAADMSLAYKEQSGELRRREQELNDREKAHELQGSGEEIMRSVHDVEFAREIAQMSDERWDVSGDQFEKPFEVDGESAGEEKQACHLYFGKVRQDPGYGIAWALTDQAGNVLLQQSKFLGLGSASYEGDYMALIIGLQYALSVGLKRIVAHGNSAPVSNQISGKWRTRSQKQLKFLEQVRDYEKQLVSLVVDTVPGSKNEYVLGLAKKAIESHVAQLVKGDGAESKSEGHSVTEDCPICFDSIKSGDMFRVRGCAHKFCVDCLSQHVEVQVKANQVPVRCPLTCTTNLEIEQCQPFLLPSVLESYSRSLTEASIPESDRVYCPFPNCSALMSKGGLSSLVIASSSRHPHATNIGCTECMECHRLFCVECQVPWHADMTCEDYQKLPPDGRDAEDAKLYKLASHQNWQRCKKCRRMIELDQGCYHMTCRCGHEFCYTCGAEWKNKQATCKCKLWDENNIIHDALTESDYDDSDSDYESEPDYFEESMFYKTKICRHWQGGYCRAGDHCTFAHGDRELRQLRRY